ncbi:MAG: carbohydrate kinase [Staphylothermus sp.]|nr:carbohydrate kinase [Staphylothermus sp.]
MSVEVYSIGEILVDIIPVEPGNIVEGKKYEVHFGGAPANVAVGVSKLGHKSGMIGAVGNDPFGKFLIETLKNYGVDYRFVKIKNIRTTLAFVTLSEEGEREFFFYRKPWVETADTQLETSDIDLGEISKSKVLHFTGFALSYPPIRNTILETIRRLSNKVVISYDPTYRSDIWLDPREAVMLHKEVLNYVNFISMSLDELEAFYKNTNYKEIARKLIDEYENITTVAIRLGAKGAYVRTREVEVFVPAFKVKSIDTTGAGDAWTAGFIVSYFLEDNDIKKSAIFANAVAGIVVTRHGAITAIPERRTVDNFIKNSNIIIY